MAYLKIQIDNYGRRICKKLHMWNSNQHKKSKRETIHWGLVELNYNRISTQESLTCKLHQTSTPNPVLWQFWTLLWILVPARGHDQNLHTWIQESQRQCVCCILLECQMFSQWYNVQKTFCRVKSTKGDFHTSVARARGQAQYLLKSSLMGVSTWLSDSCMSLFITILSPSRWRFMVVLYLGLLLIPSWDGTENVKFPWASCLSLVFASFPANSPSPTCVNQYYNPPISHPLLFLLIHEACEESLQETCILSTLIKMTPSWINKG